MGLTDPGDCCFAFELRMDEGFFSPCWAPGVSLRRGCWYSRLLTYSYTSNSLSRRALPTL